MITYKWLKKIPIKLLLFSILIQTIPIFSSPTLAKKPKHKRANVSHPHHERNNYSVNLNYAQKANLRDLIKGNYQENYILSSAIRIEIANQSNSLPPGIQKRLARGKGLPPGIAKKVKLPKTVNRHLNVSPEIDIIVVGGTVVITNPLENIILEVLRDIL